MRLKSVAFVWWDKLVIQRQRERKVPIIRWRRMKQLMMEHILPEEYEPILYKKYGECVQGKKIVTEYTNECVQQELPKANPNKEDVILAEEAVKEEKLIAKQLEKNKRELEKEKKRMDRETQEEKLAAVRPILEDLRAERDERIKQFTCIKEQLDNISEEISGYNNSSSNLTATDYHEEDLSLPKLTEYQNQLRTLQKEKADRVSKILEYLKNLASALSELWNLMDSPYEEKIIFADLTFVAGSSEAEISQPGLLTTDIIEQASEEVERLKTLKASRMKQLVMNKYAGRGAHINLKRAERARVTVSKIPTILDNLIVKTLAWEKEFKSYLGWHEQGDVGLFCGLHVDSGRMKGHMRRTLREVTEKNNISICLTHIQNINLVVQAGLLEPKYVDPFKLVAMSGSAVPLFQVVITEANGKTSSAYLVKGMYEAMGLRSGLLSNVAYCVNRDSILDLFNEATDDVLVQKVMVEMLRNVLTRLSGDHGKISGTEKECKDTGT
ncbi:hypothetical protein QQ045_020634 [Rhodiola kirilowii]